MAVSVRPTLLSSLALLKEFIMAVPQDHAYQYGMIAVCKITAMSGRGHDSLQAMAQSKFKAKRSAFTELSGCRTTGLSLKAWSSCTPATTPRVSTSSTCRWGRRKTTLPTETSGNAGGIGGSQRSSAALGVTDWKATTWSGVAVAEGASLVVKNATKNPDDQVMRCPSCHRYIWRGRLCSECGKRAD